MRSVASSIRNFRRRLICDALFRQYKALAIMGTLYFEENDRKAAQICYDAAIMAKSSANILLEGFGE